MDLTPPFSIDSGRYSVRSELGRGAHAVVYRARDERLGRDVAIKFLRPELADRGLSDRFAREIQITAQLDHPHISRLYDTGEWEGRLYYVSELAEGASLDVRLGREGQLSVEDALAIAGGIAAALDHAHERGVVHRDVKPANILLTPDGPILTDFGVARALEPHRDLALATSTGVAVGTLLYMSPEQLLAEKRLDGRADQYSLGLVLYEMLCGIRPHVSASLDGLRHLRLSGRQHSVRDHRPKVPEYVDAAVARALSPNPADRFATCGDFARALQTPSGSYPAETSQAIGSRRGVAQLRRRWVYVGVAVLVVFAGVRVQRHGWRGLLPTAASAITNAGAVIVSRPVRVIMASQGDSTAASAAAVDRLRSELLAWNGVSVTQQGVAGGDAGDDVATVVALTQPVSADSVDVTISVRRGSTSDVIGPVRTSVAAGLTERSRREMAMRIIGGPAASPDSAAGLFALTDRRRDAVQYYTAAWVRLRQGALDSAAALFRAAGNSAPDFAPAHLWAAQSLAWEYPDSANRWTAEAQRVLDQTSRATPVDSLLATALLDLGKGDDPGACRRYAEVVQRESGSFAGWFGLGECRRLDRVALNDPASPTKFRFRSNYLEALRAYDAAIDRLPSSGIARLFSRMMPLFYASPQQHRLGLTASGDSVVARPSISGDSVVFWPIRIVESRSPGPRSIPSTFLAAVRRGVAAKLAFTGRWAERAPTSYSAQQARALALEASGRLGPDGESALASLNRAEGLARTTVESLTVIVARTRVRLRVGDYRGAADQAERALRAWPHPNAALASRLAPLAALIGRVREAAVLIGAQVDESRLPAALAAQYGQVVAQGTLGECAGLDTLWTAFDQGFAVHFAPSEADSVRHTWTARTRRWVLPCLKQSLKGGLPLATPFDSAANAWLAGDTAAARRILGSIATRRQGANVAAITWDYEFAEAWLTTQLGDSAGALRRLDASLGTVAGMSEFTLDQVEQVGGLRQAFDLADRLARARGNQSLWRERLIQLGLGPSSRGR